MNLPETFTSLQAAPSGFASTLPMLAIMGVIFYFFLIRPQQKEAKEHEKLLAGLQRGDHVVTSGGIHGKVSEVRADALVLEIGERGQITIDRDAVKRKIVEPAAPVKKD